LDGYDVDVLKDDIEDVTGFSVLGTVPFFKTFDIDQIANIFQNKFNLKILN
jgi:hypothetical protein